MILGHARISTHDADVVTHVDQEARDDARTVWTIWSQAVSDTGTAANCGSQCPPAHVKCGS